MKRSFQLNLGFLLGLSLIDGCGGTLGGNPEVDSSHPSTGRALSFAITDAPVENAKNVFITVESISVLKDDGEWISIPLQTATEIDLLHYQSGLSAPLAAIDELATGTYTETRLLLSEVSPPRLISLDGTAHALKIPSGSESGLKINTPIVIEAGIPKAMVIDFDLRKSIKLTGNDNNANSKYMMKPVLRLMAVQEAGDLEAAATSGDVVCLYSAASAMDAGDDCDNALVSGVAKESELRISFIPPGTYDLRVFRSGSVLKDLTNIKIESKTTTKIEDL